jgi:perosamine synthetase
VSALALLGGCRAIEDRPDHLFSWPLIGQEDVKSCLDVLSAQDEERTRLIAAFEDEFAAWIGTNFVVAESSGANAILAALFACGVGCGDEVIVPPCTYWASVTPIMTLRATPVFADVDPFSMTISPADLEAKITPRTRAIVVTHLLGYPCEMDIIMLAARARGILVIEDASHGLGGMYRGRKQGTIADIGVFSLNRKGLAVGEGGLVVTSDRRLRDRVIAWGHGERFHPQSVDDASLSRFSPLPLGGVTSRLHPFSAALGRVQLRHFDERVAEIDRAMNCFWDLLEETPGIVAHRPPSGSGSTMGAWYNPHGHYVPEALSGLPLHCFIEAVCAEGVDSWTWNGISQPLHLQNLYQEADIYREGAPTAIVHADRDVRLRPGDLPCAESLQAFAVPAFRRYDIYAIEAFANAFDKVCRHHHELL